MNQTELKIDSFPDFWIHRVSDCNRCPQDVWMMSWMHKISEAECAKKWAGNWLQADIWVTSVLMNVRNLVWVKGKGKGIGRGGEGRGERLKTQQQRSMTSSGMWTEHRNQDCRPATCQDRTAVRQADHLAALLRKWPDGGLHLFSFPLQNSGTERLRIFWEVGDCEVLLNFVTVKNDIFASEVQNVTQIIAVAVIRSAAPLGTTALHNSQQ